MNDPTITVRGRTYHVVDEPRLNGQIAPHIYNSRGEVAGVLVDVMLSFPTGAQVGPRPAIVGAPKSWTASDVRSAIQQILA